MGFFNKKKDVEAQEKRDKIKEILMDVQTGAIDLESSIDDVAERIIKEEMNVRQVEAMVANLDKEPNGKKKVSNPLMQKYYKEVETSLGSRFGTKVKIREGAKKGKIEIEYYSKEDLERLLFELRR